MAGRPSDNAVGLNGQANTTIFWTGIDRSMIPHNEVEMVMSPCRFADGTEGWQCVLRAPSFPGGARWEFKGYGVRKPFAKDEACHWFNRQVGWVIA